MLSIIFDVASFVIHIRGAPWTVMPDLAHVLGWSEFGEIGHSYNISHTTDVDVCRNPPNKRLGKSLDKELWCCDIAMGSADHIKEKKTHSAN